MSARGWWPWFSVAALILILPLLGEGTLAVLRYEREAALSGEVWRLLSAHWVHLSGAHAAINAAALLLLLALFRGSGGGFASGFALLLACQLGVSFLLLALSPDVGWYVGLSGALHGYALVLPVFARQYPTAWLVFAALAAKVAWELALGPSAPLEALIGGRVIVIAHFHGVIAGLSVSAGVLALRRSRAVPSF